MMEPKKKKGRPMIGDRPMTPSEKMARRYEKMKERGVPKEASVNIQIVNAVAELAKNSSMPDSLFEAIVNTAATALEGRDFDRAVSEKVVRNRLLRQKKS